MAATRCESRYEPEFNDEKPINPRVKYGVLLTHDMDTVRAHKYGGKGPQPNMARDTAENQFLSAREVADVMAYRKRLLDDPRTRSQMIKVMPGRELEVRSAVEEQFAFMTSELPKKSPSEFAFDGTYLHNLVNGEKVSAKDLSDATSAEDAIYQLQKMVADDLIFLKQIDSETKNFIVIGGVLAIPSNISMSTTLSKTIVEIHENVSSDPERAAKFTAIINNSLAMLFRDPSVIVRRNNFFLYLDPTLSQPYGFTTSYQVPRITRDIYKTSAFLRTERQTLRGLPNSQVVVFALQPVVMSIGQVMMDPEFAKIVQVGIAEKFADDRRSPIRNIIKWMAEDLSSVP